MPEQARGMDTTELIRPPAQPTFSEMVAETIPLVGAIAGYGPPVIFLAGPWLLLGLVLAGPFAFLLVLVAAMLLAATVLVALAAVIVGTPYLLVRRLRSYRARRAVSTGRAAQLLPVRSSRVTA
jgi:hypothetical protein